MIASKISPKLVNRIHESHSIKKSVEDCLGFSGFSSSIGAVDRAGAIELDDPERGPEILAPASAAFRVWYAVSFRRRSALVVSAAIWRAAAAIFTLSSDTAFASTLNFSAAVL